MRDERPRTERVRRRESEIRESENRYACKCVSTAKQFESTPKEFVTTQNEFAPIPKEFVSAVKRHSNTGSRRFFSQRTTNNVFHALACIPDLGFSDLGLSVFFRTTYNQF
jgi:hypothetical protein